MPDRHDESSFSGSRSAEQLLDIVYTPTMFSVRTFIGRSADQCLAPQCSLIILSSLSVFTRKMIYGLIFSWPTVNV